MGKRLEESSRDLQFIAERRADRLAYKKVSFGYLWDIKHLVRNWKSEIAPNLRVPTLIIQGGKDVIVSHKDCEILARIKATSGTKDRQYKVFPKTRHTTLWDRIRPRFRNSLRSGYSSTRVVDSRSTPAISERAAHTLSAEQRLRQRSIAPSA